MKKYFFNFAVFLVLFVFCGIGCGCAKEQETTPSTGALDFQLPDLSQNLYSLCEYKDKQQPVILFFWTTWCPYCREELMVLKDKYAELLADGWELFGINVGESASKVDSFVKNASLPFKVLLDKSTSVAKSFGVFGVPTYVIVGKDGLIKATEHYFPEDAIKELMFSS
ncbi:MAG: TlpA disulfide reductase family protein [Candidatus Omnitrophota bacterium]